MCPGKREERGRVGAFRRAVMGERSMCGPAAIFEKFLSTDTNIHFLSHGTRGCAGALCTFSSSSSVGRLGAVDSSAVVPEAASQALCWNNDSASIAAAPKCARTPWRRSSGVRRRLIAQSDSQVAGLILLVCICGLSCDW